MQDQHLRAIKKIGRSRAFRTAAILLWCVLFALLVRRDYLVEEVDVRVDEAIRRGKEESYSSVFFRGQRIGYVHHRLSPVDDEGYELEENAHLRLNILDEIHPVAMTMWAGLSKSYLLRHFTF